MSKYTPENIMVRPIDKEKLDKYVNQLFHEGGKSTDNVIFSCRVDFAIIETPKRCLIDEEFVGWDITDDVSFGVYEETKPDSEGKSTFNMFPSKEVKFTLSELEKYLLPETTLAEFTKPRRGYNSRIRCNESAWINYLNRKAVNAL